MNNIFFFRRVGTAIPVVFPAMDRPAWFIVLTEWGTSEGAMHVESWYCNN